MGYTCNCVSVSLVSDSTSGALRMHIIAPVSPCYPGLCEPLLRPVKMFFFKDKWEVWNKIFNWGKVLELWAFSNDLSKRFRVIKIQWLGKYITDLSSSCLFFHLFCSASVLIGAPKANTNQVNVTEGGSVFYCPWSLSQSDCHTIKFDTEGRCQHLISSHGDKIKMVDVVEFTHIEASKI